MSDRQQALLTSIGSSRGLSSAQHEYGTKSQNADNLYRLFVESVSDYAILALDPTGRVVSWNTGAQRIKGYTAEEIIGQHFSRFYPQEAIDRGWPEEELQRAAQDGRFEDEG